MARRPGARLEDGLRKDAVQQDRNRIFPSLAAGGFFGILSLGAILILTYSGCGGMAPRGGETAQNGSEEAPQPSAGQAEVPTSSKRFEEPGELDKLLDAKP